MDCSTYWIGYGLDLLWIGHGLDWLWIGLVWLSEAAGSLPQVLGSFFLIFWWIEG